MDDDLKIEYVTDMHDFAVAAGIDYLHKQIQNLMATNKAIRDEAAKELEEHDRERLTVYYTMEAVLQNDELPRPARLWFYQKLTALIALNPAEQGHMQDLIDKIPRQTVPVDDDPEPPGA